MPKNFQVTATKNEVVAAALPIQERRLPLSNLDLLLPPVDVGVFFCYENHHNGLSSGQMVRIVKKALSQSLVLFYAFAGELVKNGAGQPEILCDNRVDFVEASADVELKDLDFYNPDESVEGKLVPKRKRSVFTAQVTQLLCGGLVVACTFAHQVADAYSANMFLVSWAEMAQRKPPSHSPSFHRSLLLPRQPSKYDVSIDDMYIPISALPPPPPAHGDAALSRIYYIEADRITELQTIANAHTNATKRTKLEAFSAFLWKLLGVSRLGIVVDGRSRLITTGDDTSMTSYIGNVLSIPFGEKRVDELREKSLSLVANEVHEFLKKALTKEHFLGLIDWVEEHRPEPGVSRIYSMNDKEEAVVVSSGQHFPVRRMDFGWGSPVFGSYHFPWGGKSGYVMPMPSPKGNGDWIVYMHLLKEQLEVIERDGGHVFCRLSPKYLFGPI